MIGCGGLHGVLVLIGVIAAVAGGGDGDQDSGSSGDGTTQVKLARRCVRAAGLLHRQGLAARQQLYPG